MKILNAHEILNNAYSASERKARDLALKILKAAVDAADPYAAIMNHIKLREKFLVINGTSFDLNAYNRIFVIGAGKACGAMAEALEGILGNLITDGHVNILRGTLSKFKTTRIRLHEADHPIPSEDGVKGSKRIIEIAKKAEKDDLVICLISGGGSALMPLPAEGITLTDKQQVTESLLASGATINEINVVRKHISKIKGGQLAKEAYPATLISLILSDVLGDPLDTIASGPTVPDISTYQEAISIIKKYELWQKIPKSVQHHLTAGLHNKIPETPKPSDKIFRNNRVFIIGNNYLAAKAAYEEAKKLGLNALLLSSLIQGEARHVGTVYAAIAKEVVNNDNPIQKPAAIIAGGETTVTVVGRGRGGRNQELVLSASLGIEGLSGVAVASIGTDGVDGPTDAAGAIADGRTMIRSRAKKLDAITYLKSNDSYTFFKHLNDLIFTGPTGTNVNDISVMIILDSEKKHK
jgi:glycerate-2-kinase